MIQNSVVSCIGRTPLVYLYHLFPLSGIDVIAKLEFLNLGGSIKDRMARFIIENSLREGTITQETHLIESTSGNLGITLAKIARLYSLTFTCVVDPKISSTDLRILPCLGAHIEMVDQVDDQGGYLKIRITRIHELLQTIPHSYWINQYSNQLNWQAHFFNTSTEIIVDLDRPIDCIVVAVGTTGTIPGIARRLREKIPRLRVVAVDAVGSVIFGGPPGPRQIPGVGSSRIMELLSRDEIDEIVYVNDRESVQACYDLVADEGILAGGSSGSVIAAIQKLLPTFPLLYRVLTLLPDRGERYLDMVYNEDWAKQLDTS